jgi:hypothetical protein
MSRLIDRFHCHAARETRIADQRTYVKVFVLRIARDRHPQRRRKRCRSVARTERVVLGLSAPEKSAQASVLFDRRKLVAASGEDLVCICLMPDIPDQPIPRCVENVMHRDGELDGSKRGSRVATDPRACIDDKLTNLVSDFLEVFDTKLAKVCRGVDLG